MKFFSDLFLAVVLLSFSFTAAIAEGKAPPPGQSPSVAVVGFQVDATAAITSVTPFTAARYVAQAEAVVLPSGAGDKCIQNSFAAKKIDMTKAGPIEDVGESKNGVLYRPDKILIKPFNGIEYSVGFVRRE